MLSARVLSKLLALSNRKLTHVSVPELLSGLNNERILGSPSAADGSQSLNKLPDHFGVTSEDILRILKILSKNANLESLDISELQLAVFPEIFESSPNLRVLQLRLNRLSPFPIRFGIYRRWKF